MFKQLFSPLFALACGGLYASQALLNVVEAEAAHKAVAAYTNNELRVESVATGELTAFPANMPYQLVVGPASEDRERAEAAIVCATNAMPKDVREMYLKAHVMAPVLQNLFRHCRPGVTNEALYLTYAAHPTVWRAADFDLERIKEAARMILVNSTPLLVFVKTVYEDYESLPIRRAEPLLDYPDPRPETTFETPFGIGIVLRAPENQRKFRFMARAWPVQDEKVTFAWRVIVPYGRYGARPFEGREAWLTPPRGYAEIVLDWNLIGRRMDLLVCARYGRGAYGPPTIVSFFVIPNEMRKYGESGFIEKIEYVKQDVLIPQLYQNKGWTDEYEVDQKGDILGFVRLRKGQIFGKEEFSINGEYIHEFHAVDMPKIVSSVRYFTKPDDPTALDYEILPEKKTLPFRAVEPRNRGEFFRGKTRRVPKHNMLGDER